MLWMMDICRIVHLSCRGQGEPCTCRKCEWHLALSFTCMSYIHEIQVFVQWYITCSCLHTHPYNSTHTWRNSWSIVSTVVQKHPIALEVPGVVDERGIRSCYRVGKINQNRYRDAVWICYASSDSQCKVALGTPVGSCSERERERSSVYVINQWITQLHWSPPYEAPAPIMLAEKATWNWTAKTPPEENPDTEMVSLSTR